MFATTALALILASGPIRQVDHVVVGTEDPQPLFTLFAETFGLPVAWPVASFGEYRSGGVWAGNINLEFGRAGARGVDADKPARINAIVFQPAPLAEAIPLLDARGVAHGAPVPFGIDPPSPAEAPAWTTVSLTGLSGEGLGFVLCDYLRPQVGAFRAQLARRMAAAHGGALGVVRVREVHAGGGADAAFRATWETALADAQGGGPAIVLDADAPRGRARLVLEVASLERAAAFLRAHDLLAPQTGDEVRLDPAQALGLDVRFVAAR